MKCAVVFEKSEYISHDTRTKYELFVDQGWIAWDFSDNFAWFPEASNGVHTDLVSLPAGTYTVTANARTGVTCRVYVYNTDKTKDYKLPASAPAELPYTFTLAEAKKVSVGFGYGSGWDDYSVTQSMTVDDVQNAVLTEGDSSEPVTPDEKVTTYEALAPEEISGDDTLSWAINSKGGAVLYIYPQYGAYGFCEQTLTYVRIFDLDKPDHRLIFKGRVSAVVSGVDSSGRIRQEITCASALDFLEDTTTSAGTVSGDVDSSTGLIADMCVNHNNALDGDIFRSFIYTLSAQATATYTAKNVYCTRWKFLNDMMTGGDMRKLTGGVPEAKGYTMEFRETYQNDITKIEVAESFGEHKGTALLLGDNLKELKIEQSAGDGRASAVLALSGVNSTGSREYYRAENADMIKKYGRGFDKIIINDSIVCTGTAYEWVGTSDPHKVYTAEWRAMRDDLYHFAKSEAEKLSDPEMRVTLSALDLARIGMAGYDGFEVGDWYPVVCPPLGLYGQEMRITGITRKLATPQVAALTIAKGQQAGKFSGGTMSYQVSQSSGGDSTAAQSNAAEIAQTAAEDQTGGMDIVKIDKDDFDDLPVKDPGTMYIVNDDGELELWIGDQHITSGEGGGTIELAAVLSEEQLTEWAPEHELVPVSFRGSATVYYGQAPSRFVLQGQRMCYGVTELLPSDVLSELTLEFFDGARQKAKIFLAGMTLNSVTLGVEIYDISGGADTLIGRGTAAAAFSLPASFSSMQIGMVHWCNGFTQRGGDLVPSGGMSLAVMIDGVQLADPGGIASRFPAVNGSYFTDNVSDHVQRMWGSTAEMYFAEALSRKTEPSVDEPESAGEGE